MKIRWGIVKKTIVVVALAMIAIMCMFPPKGIIGYRTDYGPPGVSLPPSSVAIKGTDFNKVILRSVMVLAMAGIGVYLLPKD